MLEQRYSGASVWPWLLALVVAYATLAGCGGLLGRDGESGNGASGAASGTAGASDAGNASVSICATGGQTSVDVDECSGDGYCATYCIKADQCTVVQYEAEIRKVNTLLVVEASALMNKAVASSDGASRWQVLKSSLRPVLRSDIDFGLEIFPYDVLGIDSNLYDPPNACLLPSNDFALRLPIAPGYDHLAEIFEVLQSHTPAGNSPLASALERAYDYFVEGEGRCLPGSRWVLLVSTGAADCNPALSCTRDRCIPNMDSDIDASASTCPLQGDDPNCCTNAGHRCLDDVAVIDQIGRLAAAGIRTFVVGVPSSDEQIDLLNRAADAGGVPNPNQPERFYWFGEGHSGQADLLQALSSVATQPIRTCEFELSSSPRDIAGIRLSIDCNLVPPNPSGDDSGDGWTLDESHSPPRLQVHGIYCRTISATGAIHVDILYDCRQ